MDEIDLFGEKLSKKAQLFTFFYPSPSIELPLTHYLTPTFRIHFSIFYPNIFDQHKLKSSPSPQNSPLKYTSLKNPIIDDSYTSIPH